MPIDIDKVLNDDTKNRLISELIDVGLVEVTNLGEIEFPSSVDISNLGDLERKLDDLNSSVGKIELSPRVDVSSPDVNVDVNLEPLLTELQKALKKLKENSATKPLAVRLSDGKKFINKLTAAVKDGLANTVISSPGQVSVRGVAKDSTLQDILNALGGATVSSATNTKVSVGSGSTTVLAANSSRKEYTLVNDSDEVIYVSRSGTAVINEGIRLNSAGGTLTDTSYTGAVTAICASGSKNLTVSWL